MQRLAALRSHLAPEPASAGDSRSIEWSGSNGTVVLRPRPGGVTPDDIIMGCGPLSRANVSTLKDLAVQRGVKREGLGWAACCPPRGQKADVRAALIKHVRAETSPYRPYRAPPTKSLFESVGQRVEDSSGLAIMAGFLVAPFLLLAWFS